MKNLATVFSACAAAFAMVNTQASVFTTEPEFLAALTSSTTVNFSANSGGVANNTVFGSGAFTAQISSSTAGSLQNASGVLYAGFPSASITINNFSSAVTGVGSFFYLSDGGSATAQAGGPITITYTDSTGPNVQNITTLLLGDKPYRGFTAPSGATITSIVFTGGSAGVFNTIDNLTLGAAVPEPSQWGLFLGSGLALFGAYRRFRK